jgi:hypothetical protein
VPGRERTDVSPQQLTGGVDDLQVMVVQAHRKR